MAVPKKCRSLERRRSRRAQMNIVLPNISRCKNCGNAHLPHHMCRSCGFYNGKCIIAPKIKKEKE